MAIVKIEVTDTFPGEPNYSWVRRGEIESDGITPLQLIRRLKASVGLTGVRCTLDYDTGDLRRYNVIGASICFFIVWEY